MDTSRAVKFVLEGDFKEYDKSHYMKRHFFLFNNLLLITKVGLLKSKHTVKYSIPIENCIVWDKTDLPGKIAFQIVRTDSTEKVVFICTSDGMKTNWMNQINDCISASGGKYYHNIICWRMFNSHLILIAFMW